jgi:hypothetical protein
MKLAIGVVSALVMVAGASASVLSSNGYRLETRIFNDFASSNLTVNTVNYAAPTTDAIAGFGTSIDIDEDFAFGTPGNFANKHVAYFSNDGGATKARTVASESFELSFCVNLSAPAGQPRKEAGIDFATPRQFNNDPPFVDEGQLLIASDGEVAVFGSTLPFTGFGNNAYTLGTTALVTFTYYAPGDLGSQAAYRLIFQDAVNGTFDSGFKFWGVEPDGINGLTNATMGFKAQNQRNPFINDSSKIVYDCAKIVPAPGAAGMLALAGVFAARRRRA